MITLLEHGDGYRIEKNDRWTTLWVSNKQHINNGIRRFNAGDIDGFVITDTVSTTDINRMADLASPHCIEIPYANGCDLSALYKFTSLKYLRVMGPGNSLDCRHFPQLDTLSIEWNSLVELPSNDSPLIELYMWKYRGDRDLTSLPCYPKLATLYLIQCPLQCLDGVDRFESIRLIDCAYMPKLRRVAALNNTTIISIHFECCPNIEDLASLSSCFELTSLRLIRCGALINISFLNNFPKLEDFRFVDTNILDGDLTPLLRLKSIGSLEKRHYKPSVAEIKNRIGDTSP